MIDVLLPVVGVAIDKTAGIETAEREVCEKQRAAPRGSEGQLYAFDPIAATFKPVLGVDVAPTVAKGTSLSAIKPERLIAAAGKKPSF